ncbi:D-glucuronyl C5-epimerase family protein [Methanothermobacter sp. DP]|uniref:D-glucuronyl C5-epimerase family protein n=1 Tax=Methanothermobacter sp. DP TaxID=2998972 RepID=UPI002AA501B0|nr:D-glucuronyl C5-epimerase family protein [Methanothermobacter sp. DP]
MTRWCTSLRRASLSLLKGAVKNNTQIRNHLYTRYTSTGDRRYYQAYVDAGYAVKVFSGIKSKRPLRSDEKIVEIKTIQANNAYFSRSLPPAKSYTAIVFGNTTSYYRNFPSDYESSLPFMYYKYKGWNPYPVIASNLAGASNQTRFLEVLDEQKLMVSFRTYQGMRFAVFPMYFEYSGSAPGWLDSFAQGNLAGHYARAYRLTGNREYLDISDSLINSFQAPTGLMKYTRYGYFYLHYNFLRQHYILNAHLICTLGLHNAYTQTGNTRAHWLFRAGVSTFRKMNWRFDSGRWTYYALSGPYYKPAWLTSEGYHRLHVQLANRVWKATGDSYYRSIALRWNTYLKRKGLRPERI